MKALPQNNQSGRSMVEMLGVLAIIGVLSVGGISGYSKAMEKYKMVKTYDQVQTLLMNIREAYAGQPSYTGLAHAYIGLAPDEMLNSDGTALVNVYGGATSANYCNSSACGEFGDVQHFYIQMLNMSDTACTALASADWGTDGLAGIMINNTGNLFKFGGESGNTLPISPAKAADKCKEQTSSNKYVRWIYY